MEKSLEVEYSFDIGDFQDLQGLGKYNRQNKA
jgi:hypothetical protein